MKMLLTWPATPVEVAQIRRHVPANVKIVMTPACPYLGETECELADMHELVPGAAVIMGWMRIPPESLEAATGLKFVAWLKDGCDQLHFPTLRRLGIQVSNARGGLDVALAESVFAFILGFAKKLIVKHQAAVEARFLPQWQPDVPSVELARKTVAIIGLGGIGEAVAERAKAFKMNVLGVKKNPSKHCGNADRVFSPDKLHEVLSRADFVVLSVPLTPETRRMIGEAELQTMRRTAYLINISRSDLVQEGPLARALTEGWIAGYGSDVWWHYPDAVPPGHHFAVPSRLGIHRMPNVLAAGANSGNIPELKERVIELGAESVGAFLRGEVPPRLVDLQLGY